MTRMNDPRRDRKILVAVCLAGSQFARSWSSRTGYIGLGTGISHPLSSAHADRAANPI